MMMKNESCSKCWRKNKIGLILRVLQVRLLLFLKKVKLALKAQVIEKEENKPENVEVLQNPIKVAPKVLLQKRTLYEIGITRFPVNQVTRVLLIKLS